MPARMHKYIRPGWNAVNKKSVFPGQRQVLRGILPPMNSEFDAMHFKLSILNRKERRELKKLKEIAEFELQLPRDV